MNTFPQGITNNFQNNQLNFSYVHAALQPLCFLDTTKNLFSFMESNGMRYNNFFPMANELLKIIERVNSGIVPDSQNILFYFGKKYLENQMNIVSKNVLASDPFHFLYFLFQFLHLETNMCNKYDNNLFNQSLNAMRNDDYIYMQFLMFIMKTQNSIISNDFFNTVRYTYDCQMCGKYYFYGLQNIFRMNIDMIRYFRDKAYPMKQGTNLDLSELFTCYSGGTYNNCRNCGNNRCPRYTRICFPAKTIIISLERKNHSFKNDINILSQIDLEPFISKKRTAGLNLNTIYELKAVISYINFGNQGKYFSICKIKKNNNQMWVRYIDSFYQVVQPSDVCIYEPQMLIYEIYNPPQVMGNDMNNNMNNNMFGGSIIGNNNNDYISFANMNDNQTRMMYNNQNMMNNNMMNNNMMQNNSVGIMNNNNMMNNNMMNNNQNMIQNNMVGMMNNNNNINMNNFQMMGFNNNNMMQNMNLMDNMKTFKNYNKVDPSIFNKIPLIISEKKINLPQNNFVNFQQQQMNNNQFMQQVNQFNNTKKIPNMQIDILPRGTEKISIEEAQMSNLNMMKYFSSDYLAGDLISESVFNNPNNN